MYFEFLILLRACWAQPVCLPAIQVPAHTLNQTTLKHWQFYSLLLGSTLVSAWAPCLGAAARALAAFWGIQLLLVSFTRLAATIISCLLTSSTRLQTGVRKTWASSWGVNNDLQNIQAILPSSSSEILSER
jgi:hypothetical protein